MSDRKPDVRSLMLSIAVAVLGCDRAQPEAPELGRCSWMVAAAEDEGALGLSGCVVEDLDGDGVVDLCLISEVESSEHLRVSAFSGVSGESIAHFETGASGNDSERFLIECQGRSRSLSGLMGIVESSEVGVASFVRLSVADLISRELIREVSVAGELHGACGTADHDGDGFSDFALLVQQPGMPNEIVIISAGDCSILQRIRIDTHLSGALASLGGYPGERERRFACGWPKASEGGRVDLLRSDGTQAWSVSSKVNGMGFGDRVFQWRDMTGDGIEDLGVYCSGYSPDRFDVTGKIVFLDGGTGAELLEISGRWGAEFFGRSAAPCGDLDGDGVGEIAVGSSNYHANAGGSVFRGVRNGKVDVFNGATGRLLYRWIGPSNSEAGNILGVRLDSRGAMVSMFVGAPLLNKGRGAVLCVDRDMFETVGAP